MQSNSLQWKVCGMRDPDNIREVAKLSPDYMGFIFYPGSKRFVGQLDPDILKDLKKIQKVGVFVDQPLKEVLNTVVKYELDLVQLHGKESLEYVKEMATENIQIINVMSGNNVVEQKEIDAYSPFITHWLFDTRLDLHGGNGVLFEWKNLDKLMFNKPLILSGGIGPEQLKKSRNAIPKNVIAVDVNSQVESAPAVKNIELLVELKKYLS